MISYYSSQFLYDHNNWYQEFRLRYLGSYLQKFNIIKFEGTGNFELWKMRVKDLLVQQNMMKVLCENKPKGIEKTEWKKLEVKAVATIRFCLDGDVMYCVMNEELPVAIWSKLESQYMLSH